MSWTVKRLGESLAERPSVEVYPNTAFVLSLIAGILTTFSGAVAVSWFSASQFWWGGMMGRGMGMMGPMNFGFLLGGMATIGLASGLIVLISAILLRSRPKEYTTWGVLILVFSILSFLSMGGFLVGAILGIVGGALALSWKPGNVS